MSDRSDFGRRLREAREARGISLSQIAAVTKISVPALAALERNDVSRLPGGLFSRAFVRAYAREVGLDPDETVREFVEAFPEEPSLVAPQQRSVSKAETLAEPGRHSSGFRWFGLLVTVVLIIVVFAFDRYLSRPAGSNNQPASQQSTSRRPSASQPPQQQIQEPAASPSPATQPGAGEQNVQATPGATTPPGAEQPGAVTPGAAQPGVAGQPQPGTAPAAQPPGTPPATPAQPTLETTAPSPAEAAAMPLHVVLAPTAPCWVSAKVDGKRLVGRTLQPGDRIELAAAQAIVITAGDAGALGYTVNGAAGRPLGTAGKVVTAVITPSNAQTFVGGPR